MRSLAPIPLLAGLILASCVTPTLYHDQAELCSGDPQSECSRAFVEDHPEYLLGFIEFDDLGWAWERQQGRLLRDAVKKEERDLLMVVFVHGWKHNASTCDTNVACFRETLRRLYATEKKLAEALERPERRVVGVYVGWRGLSMRAGMLGQATFYGRKATAHKVGSGAVTELIVRLDEVRKERISEANTRIREATKRNKQRQKAGTGEALEPVPEPSSTRLVVVGHSFGGALVFSASSQLMMQKLVVAHERGGAVEGLGDLVVLVNPAFEAARYQPLHETVNEPLAERYTSAQNPVFAIFTSDGDGATGRAFPLGRFFSAKRDDYRTDGLRELQRRSNRAAVGHFPPFRTHFLRTNEGTPVPEKVPDRTAVCGCPFLVPEGAELRAARDDAATIQNLHAERESMEGTQMTFPTATLVYEEGPGTENRDKRSAFSPIQVITVDNQIITGHNDIYRPAFIDFLRYYIMLSTEPSSSPAAD